MGPHAGKIQQAAGGEEGDMEQIHYNIEGAEFDVPVYYDELAGRETEHLPDFLETPIYTPSGERVMLTIEDACASAAPADGETRCIDCGSCRYYRQTPGTLLGVCRQETMCKRTEILQTRIGEKEKKP